MVSRVACATAAVFFAISASAAAETSPNLIVNPDAEASPGATSASQPTSPPGWAVTGGRAGAGRYGSAQWPRLTVSQQIGGGANLFVGGPRLQPDGPYALTQTFDATAHARLIDSGKATMRLSGFIGGYATQEDNAVITASLIGADAAPAVSAQIGPVTIADRNRMGTLLPRNACVRVLSGLRNGVVTIAFQRVSGGNVDGYADNLSLTLSDLPCPALGAIPLEPPAPPLPGVAGNADVLRGTVAVTPPGSRAPVYLADVSKIPVWSEVNTTRGEAELVTAAPTPGQTQSVRVSDGAFVMTQPANAAFTDMRLSTKFDKCPRRISGSSAGDDPEANKAARKRRLWSNGSGRYRTRGRKASATVRGRAIWLVQDTCAGTLVRVTRGSLVVRDFSKRRSVRLRAPGRYLAK